MRKNKKYVGTQQTLRNTYFALYHPFMTTSNKQRTRQACSRTPKHAGAHPCPPCQNSCYKRPCLHIVCRLRLHVMLGAVQRAEAKQRPSTILPHRSDSAVKWPAVTTPATKIEADETSARASEDKCCSPRILIKPSNELGRFGRTNNTAGEVGRREIPFSTPRHTKQIQTGKTWNPIS